MGKIVSVVALGGRGFLLYLVKQDSLFGGCRSGVLLYLVKAGFPHSPWWGYKTPTFSLFSSASKRKTVESDVKTKYAIL